MKCEISETFPKYLSQVWSAHPMLLLMNSENYGDGRPEKGIVTLSHYNEMPLNGLFVDTHAYTGQNF